MVLKLKPIILLLSAIMTTKLQLDRIIGSKLNFDFKIKIIILKKYNKPYTSLLYSDTSKIFPEHNSDHMNNETSR